jgi:hypothetical protein
MSRIVSNVAGIRPCMMAGSLKLTTVGGSTISLALALFCCKDVPYQDALSLQGCGFDAYQMYTRHQFYSEAISGTTLTTVRGFESSTWLLVSTWGLP